MALVSETANQALAANAPYVMLTSRPELRPLYEGRCGFRVDTHTIALTARVGDSRSEDMRESERKRMLQC